MGERDEDEWGGNVEGPSRAKQIVKDILHRGRRHDEVVFGFVRELGVIWWMGRALCLMFPGA